MPSEEFHNTHQESQRPLQEDTVAALGEVAAQGNVDLSEQSTEVPDTAVDVSKAWDMAHAGKDDHDKAASERRDADKIIQKIEEVPAIIGDIVESQKKVDDVLRANYKDPYDSSKTYDEGENIGYQKTQHEHMTLSRPEDYDSEDPWKSKLYDEEADIATEEDRMARDQLIAIEGLNDPSKAQRYLDKIRELAAEIATTNADFTESKSYKDLLEEVAMLERWHGRDRIAPNTYDERAQRHEEWAEILHDKAPSEAYKERYGIEVITPSILVAMEDDVDDKLKAVKDAEVWFDRHFKSPDDILPESNLYGTGIDTFLSATDIYPDENARGGYRHPKQHRSYMNATSYSNGRRMRGKEHPALDVKGVADFAFTPGSPESEEYKALISDDNTTLGERNKAYAKAVKSAAKNMAVTVKLKQAFLNDIKSGRAASWQ